MSEFFDNDKNFAHLLAELEGWEGTPFNERLCKKGVGADCIKFVITVLVNVGAIQPIIWPKYVTRGGGIEMRDLLIKHMEMIPQMKVVWKKEWKTPPPAAKRGRVMVMSTGEAIHHTGIVVVPPTFWHCMKGVDTGAVSDPSCRKNLFAVYRVDGTA